MGCLLIHGTAAADMLTRRFTRAGLLCYAFLAVHERSFSSGYAMALTGDLAQLHITDIIQLIHTTRKSGTLTVTGDKGESRIIFSCGYLVGASHLNNRIRIGTVLVKMHAITPEDLKGALDFQKKAGKNRQPLLKTLMQMGKVADSAAFKGLKKLIEITIVELISWTGGTFTFDDKAIAVCPECSYHPGEMEQEISLDAQMVLMDALRVFDERERDKQAGQKVPSYEITFADVLPAEETVGAAKTFTAITADILGLADLDRMENKIAPPVPVPEIFDPVEIHRQKIREILADFPADGQEAFVAFLRTATDRAGSPQISSQEEEQSRAVILFSTDTLLTHAALTICKNDGTLVFSTSEEDELDRIISQCQSMKIIPSLVFDSPGNFGSGLHREGIAALRLRARDRHPGVPMFQLAAPQDYVFTLQSFRDGIQAVLPKPDRETGKETFIADMITFLESFRTFARGFLYETSHTEAYATKKLKDLFTALQTREKLADISYLLLQSVSQVFARSIAFMVLSEELVGDRAFGVVSGRNAGPEPAVALKIPLDGYSVFRDVIEGGEPFFGESDDEVLREYLFAEIGKPLRQTVFLLPLKSHGQVRALIYGDFGKKNISPVPVETFQIQAQHAGLVLENAAYRAQILKTQKA